MRGTSIRMERIFNRSTGNAVIIPMDHGVTVGPIKGIKSVKNIADAVARGERMLPWFTRARPPSAIEAMAVISA